MLHDWKASDIYHDLPSCQNIGFERIFHFRLHVLHLDMVTCSDIFPFVSNSSVHIEWVLFNDLTGINF